MKFYHGTTSDSADCIDSEGFGGSELSTQTDGFTNSLQSGVLFVAATPEHASEYGEVVYEVELLNESPTYFNRDAMDRDEYYIPIDVLNADGIWRRI